MIFGILGLSVSSVFAVDQPVKEDLAMPAPNDRNLVKTLNNLGYMVMEPDSLSQRFLDYVKQTKGRFLDVGTAFGQMSLMALEAGASFGVANDIDEKQLKIFQERLPAQYKDRIAFMPGSFPDKVIWPEYSGDLDAILMARVIHFMTGTQIEQSLKIAYEKLKPGGKVFILVSSPYLWQMDRLKTQLDEGKKKGEKWPGFTTKMWELCPLMINVVQPTFHMLDFDIMFPAIKESGFFIEYFEELTISKDGSENINSKNGKETLAFILRKPKNGV
jgi:SAM-dependent methyltransferase